VAEAQVQAEAAQGAQAGGQPVDLQVAVHRLLADAAGRPALGVEAVGQVGDRLLEALAMAAKCCSSPAISAGSALAVRWSGRSNARAQEAATEVGPVPTSILRATQFHGFAGQLIDWVAKGGLLPCPKQPVQTVDVDAVADQLVAMAHEETTDQHVRRDLAGPEKGLLADRARAIARARGQRLLVVPVWLPGATAKKIRAGVLQAPAGAVIDGGTFEEWLARETAS
jgi:hypothetical protein